MIKIVVKENVFELKTKVVEVPFVGGTCIFNYLTRNNPKFEKYLEDILRKHKLIQQGAVEFYLNYTYLSYNQLYSIIPKDNDVINVIFKPKADWMVQLGMSLVMIGVSVGVEYLIESMLEPNLPPEGNNPSEIPNSTTYNWDGATTSYALGRPIPLIYGKNRTAGSIISSMVEGLPAGQDTQLKPRPGGEDFDINYIEGTEMTYNFGENWWDDVCTITINPVLAAWTGNPTPSGFYLKFSDLFTQGGKIHPFSCYGFTARCAGVINYTNDCHHVVIAYKLSRRFWLYDETKPEIAPTVYQDWHFPTDPHEFQLASVSCCEQFAVTKQGQHGNMWYFNDGTPIVTVAPQFNSEGKRVYWEYAFCEAILFSCGKEWYEDPIKVSLRVDGMLRASSKLFKYYGSTTDDVGGTPSYYIQETGTASYSDGLRMVMAISDGEVCNISTSSGSILVNDTPYGYLFDIPSNSGDVKPFTPQTSYGDNYPIIEKEMDETVNTNLLNKTNVGMAKFDYLLLPVPTFSYTTVSNCSAINIHIDFKRGLYEYTPAGVLLSNTTNLYVKYRPLGTSNWTYVTLDGPTDVGNEIDHPFTVTQAKPQPFTLVIRIGNEYTPLPTCKYEVNIHREGTGDTGPWKYSECYISNITEYLYDFQRYPNVSLFGAKIIATDKLANSPPTISTEVLGRYLKTPVLRDSNGILIPLQKTYTVYDTDNNEYIWHKSTDDSILTISEEDTLYEYSNNPALIVYDLITTQNLFPFIETDTLVWEDFIYAASFCWEKLFANIVEGWQHRFECNIVIDGKTDAAELINQLTTTFRLKLVWVGNKLRLVVLQPEPTVQRFTLADMIPDSYQESYLPQEAKLSTIEVTFYNEENYFKQENLIIATGSRELTTVDEEVRQTYSIIGTSNLYQAIRVGKYLLALIYYKEKEVEFKTTLRGLSCIPTNVIQVDSEAVHYTYSGYLRAAPSGTRYFLNEDIVIPQEQAGTYAFAVQSHNDITSNHPSYVTGAVTMASGSTDYITCTLSPNFTIEENDTWYLYPVSGAVSYAKEYRITSIDTDSTQNICTIKCEPYVSSVYTDDPFKYQLVYTPPIPYDRVFPPDVINLTAKLVVGTFNIKVTYNIPTEENAYMFTSAITNFATVNGQIRLFYDSASNDSQLLSSVGLYVFSPTTGQLVDSVGIISINKNQHYITICNNTKTPVVGNIIVQKQTGRFLPVAYAEVFISLDGIDFTFYGNDHSKGAGYLILADSSYANKKMWIKVRTVAATGVKSQNPAITWILLGTEQCLPPPNALAICGQGDGSTFFTGCDVCIEWKPASHFSGAGQGTEDTAGDVPAGGTKDYKITGFEVKVFDFTDLTVPMRSVIQENTQFKYSSQDNIDDQLSCFGKKNKGQRKLEFVVSQQDEFGNSSCEPAVIDVENVAPSMHDYDPTVRSGEGFISIDWSSFVQDPVLYAHDILGYQLWYGVSGPTMQYIDITDPLTSSYRLSGLPPGNYLVFLIPYDCFGVGSPLGSYRSNIKTAAVSLSIVTPLIAPKPRGITGVLSIRAVTTGMGGYHIFAEDSPSGNYDETILTEPYGITAEGLAVYNENYIYYNSDDTKDGYCYVTATDLNITSNLITSMEYTEASGWDICFPAPMVTSLTDNGYTVADGIPCVGQQFTINAYAGYMYSEAGGLWSSGLSAILYARWWQVDPGETIQSRLFSYKFKAYNLTGTLLGEYSYPVDRTHPAIYYPPADRLATFGNIAPEKELNFSFVITSDSGNESTEPLYLNGIRPIKESLAVSACPIGENDWRVVTNEEGTDIQVVLDNWDSFWQNPTVSQVEVYASVGYWNFGTSTWQVNTRFKTDLAAIRSIHAYEEFTETDGEHSRILNYEPETAGVSGYYYLGQTNGPIFAWENKGISNVGSICTHAGANSCTLGCLSYRLNGDCPYGSVDDCFGEGTCSYSPSGSTSRTAEGINYNKYYVALGVRLLNGQLLWVRDGSNAIVVKEAEFELIDEMFIKNAAITTAKIKDLSVTNAKVRNLSAQKVWIGDYAAASGWVPWTEHCAWDLGYMCKSHGWTDEQSPPSGYYKTGLCPTGYSSRPTHCNYAPSEFAIDRIFNIYGAPPSESKEYTYIQGGMIVTNSIKARSIQVGALPYTIDLDVHQEFDSHTLFSDKLKIIWHKGGCSENTNGRIGFVNGEGFFIRAGDKTWTSGAGELPDGLVETKKMYIGYIADYAGLELDDAAAISFAELSFTIPEEGWNIDHTFTTYRQDGKLPVFVVAIVNNMPLDPGIFGGGEADGAAIEDDINSDIGQLRAYIIKAQPAVGTYIRNDDVTTGIIHNPIWTSFLDLRHYTGYNELVNYVGHGRLVLDGPSMGLVSGAATQYGDFFGTSWWKWTGARDQLTERGLDTRLLIGRPYVSGLENMFSGETRATIEALSDDSYLWFYKEYDTNTSGWVGNLEIGGKLRVKDTSDATARRDLLIGKEYVENEGGMWNIKNAKDSSINYYDITGYYATNYLTDPLPIMHLGKSLEIHHYTGNSISTRDRSVTFGSTLIGSELRPEASFGLYDWESDPPGCLAKMGGTVDYGIESSVYRIGSGYFTYDIALDIDNHSHIVYINQNNTKVIYATNSSGTLVETTVRSGVANLDSCMICVNRVGGTNYIHIGWVETGSPYYIHYTKKAEGGGNFPSPDHAASTTFPSDVYRRVSLAVSNAGYAYFVFRGSDLALKYVTNATGTWTATPITVGSPDISPILHPILPKLALFSDEKMIITYGLGATNRIRAVSNVGPYWTDDEIGTGYGSFYSSVAVNRTTDTYYIVYHDVQLRSGPGKQSLYMIESGRSSPTKWEALTPLYTYPSAINFGWWDIAIPGAGAGYDALIVYNYYDLLVIKYRNGSTVIEGTDMPMGDKPQLALTTTNKVYVIYGYSNSNLVAVSNSSGGWKSGLSYVYNTPRIRATNYFSAETNGGIAVLIDHQRSSPVSVIPAYVGSSPTNWDGAACCIIPKSDESGGSYSTGLAILGAAESTNRCAWDMGTDCAMGYRFEYNTSPCPYGKVGSCKYEPKLRLSYTGQSLETNSKIGIDVKIQGSCWTGEQYTERSGIRIEGRAGTETGFVGLEIDPSWAQGYVAHIRFWVKNIHDFPGPADGQVGDFGLYWRGGANEYYLLFKNSTGWRKVLTEAA